MHLPFDLGLRKVKAMDKAIKRYFPVFALPTLAAFTIGFILPFALGVYLSLCEFTTVTDAKFVGFKNYMRIWGDGTFIHSLWYTALFTIVSVLNNGYTVKSNVKIKPVNKLPKIVLSPAKCNLYSTNNNKYTVSVSLKNSSIDLNNITGIKIDTSGNKSNADKFLLVNNISKNGTVSFGLAGDKSSIKKGQYKIKCLVTFRDADSESKPAAVNMTITVK